LTDEIALQVLWKVSSANKRMECMSRKAHEALDKAVDQCYRKESFTSERERVEYLFDLYRKLTEGYGAEEEGKKRKGRK
jgi:hypothetical protein